MKDQEILYSEKQRFRQWWIWVLILPTPVICLWGTIQQIILGIPFGNAPANDLFLILIAVVFGVGLPLFLYVAGLDTEVTASEVRIRFRPIHRNWVRYFFNQIEDVQVHIYSPIRDYGGWGIRYGKLGKAYNVSGNAGVLVTLKNGSRVLVGSGRSEILSRVISDQIERCANDT